MSADKYPYTFSRQVEAVGYLSVLVTKLNQGYENRGDTTLQKSLKIPSTTSLGKFTAGLISNPDPPRPGGTE